MATPKHKRYARLMMTMVDTTITSQLTAAKIALNGFTMPGHAMKIMLPPQLPTATNTVSTKWTKNASKKGPPQVRYIHYNERGQTR